MLRYLILLTAILMPICLGSTYSWPVFVEPLKEALHLGQGAVQIPFTVFYIVFPVTTLFAGKYLAKIGPRACAMVGGFIFGAGWVIAGSTQGSFAQVILGVGVLGGIGVGIAYLAPITTIVRWFPRHKGLVTGLSVAGFGGGPVLVSRLANMLYTSGWSPFSILRLFGVAFILIACTTGYFLRNPDEEPTSGPDSASSRHGLAGIRKGSRLVFWLLYFGMMTGLMAGFTVNSNLKQLLTSGSSASSGLAAIGWFAAANALGRIGWGLIFDRVRSSVAVQVNLLFQAAVLLSAFWLLRTPEGLQVFAFLAGLNYGGVLVIYPSTVTRLWGNAHMGRMYGYLFSSNALAASAPILAGMVYDRTGTFLLPLAAIGVAQIVAALLLKGGLRKIRL